MFQTTLTDVLYTVNMNKKGFSLIEVVAAIFIFSLAALFAANILAFTVKHYNRLTTRAELREEAWISVDFLTTQVRLADGYRIIYRSGSTLRQLDLFITLLEGAPEHNYMFRYDKGNRRLDFGGVNTYAPGGVTELASGISDVSIIIDYENELMYITVTAQKDGESITLDTCVSLRYKELR